MSDQKKPLTPKEQALKDFQELMDVMDRDGPAMAVKILRLLPKKRFLALCKYCG